MATEIEDLIIEYCLITEVKTDLRVKEGEIEKAIRQDEKATFERLV